MLSFRALLCGIAIVSSCALSEVWHKSPIAVCALHIVDSRTLSSGLRGAPLVDVLCFGLKLSLRSECTASRHGQGIPDP